MACRSGFRYNHSTTRMIERDEEGNMIGQEKIDNVTTDHIVGNNDHGSSPLHIGNYPFEIFEGVTSHIDYNVSRATNSELTIPEISNGISCVHN